MDMTTSPSPTNPSSPTGRLTTSQPELQFFPGTPQALAQERRMREAIARHGNTPLVDFTTLEDRVSIDQVQDYLSKR
jgi:hypothetical protein